VRIALARSVLTIFISYFSSFSAYALAPTSWQIVPEKSEITFTATQNNSPVLGSFKRFTGEINFDRDNLSGSDVTIHVALDSVSTSYAEVANTLKTADWFNVKIFPEAVFTAKSFNKLGDNKYQAEGNLTIRDKTVSVVLRFTLDEYGTQAAQATGTAIVKRTQFGIGQGEWQKTDEVKDDVTIKFILKAVK